MSSSTSGAGNVWPAQVIHVNEDGWILVNRGRAHGVVPGLRLLVVGTGIRELRNVMAAGDDQPLALRIRRTYEELDVLYVEESCAIAVATRAAAERRPKFYRGPDGELLVWVPLPEGWTYPRPDTSDDDDSDDSDDQDYQDSADDSGEDSEDTADAETPDVPPELGEQDDERWEEALPLNGVAVGDLVVPAVPTTGAATSATTGAVPSGTNDTSSAPNPFEAGRDYGWMKPEH